MSNWLDDILNNKHAYQSYQQRYKENNELYEKRERERLLDRDRTDEYAEKRSARESYPFIGWDTEGTNVDATPFLFGSSEGHRIAHPRIRSMEMFELVLDAEREEPHFIHVIYGGEYDFNMMLRDLDRRHLSALKLTNKTEWYGYKIEHIPRKWLTIKKDGVVAKIYDVVSFFAAPYVQALEENKIGSDDDLAVVIEGKQGRSSFTYEDLADIEPYWRTELKLLPLLMDKTRDAFYRAGVYIHSWHGPGSLARYMLKQHNIKEAMAIVPDDVHLAARYAFCGGRFESFQAGLFEGTVYNADVNSAYPYAATLLPDLAHGEWEHVPHVDRSRVSKEQFALYHVRFSKLNPDRTGLCVEPQPLFRRLHDDRVQWPNLVEGWYWSPESATVADNPYAEFIEGWIFHGNGARPFRWLNEYYDHRLKLKALNDPMQLAFKLGPNSVYGQLAMRAGWQRYKGAPPYHQIEWAGYVTSMCRSMVYEAASYCWKQNGLISIDTDGVFATCPIPASALRNGPGKALGQWSTNETVGMLNWQSGVYWLRNGDSTSWDLRKARGAPKGKIPFANALEALSSLGEIKYKRNELIGYRWGLRNGMEDWRYFVEKDRSLKFGGSEFSKRFHNPRACRLCRGLVSGTMHDLHPVGNGFASDAHSKMHVLPWERFNDHQRIRDPNDLKGEIMIDAVWADEG